MYRTLFACLAVLIIAHCGKPHHGRPAAPATIISDPEAHAPEHDAV